MDKLEGILNTLTSEQISKINLCKTTADILDFAKLESITITSA